MRDGRHVGFFHGTGHGLGLEMHEAPRFQHTRSFEPGMVITVEPGLYYPGLGGVRIEDVVAVTAKGCECFPISSSGWKCEDPRLNDPACIGCPWCASDSPDVSDCSPLRQSQPMAAIRAFPFPWPLLPLSSQSMDKAHVARDGNARRRGQRRNARRPRPAAATPTPSARSSRATIRGSTDWSTT